jgi:hypothetical protein
MDARKTVLPELLIPRAKTLNLGISTFVFSDISNYHLVVGHPLAFLMKNDTASRTAPIKIKTGALLYKPVMINKAPTIKKNIFISQAFNGKLRERNP